MKTSAMLTTDADGHAKFDFKLERFERVCSASGSSQRRSSRRADDRW